MEANDHSVIDNGNNNSLNNVDIINKLLMSGERVEVDVDSIEDDNSVRTEEKSPSHSHRMDKTSDDEEPKKDLRSLESTENVPNGTADKPSKEVSPSSSVENLPTESLKKDEKKPRTHKKKSGARKMKFHATCVEELPKEMKKLAKEAKIPTEELDAHFDVLLNILHFFTKKVFMTREDDERAASPPTETRTQEEAKPQEKRSLWPFSFLTKPRASSKDDLKGPPGEDNAKAPRPASPPLPKEEMKSAEVDLTNEKGPVQFTNEPPKLDGEKRSNSKVDMSIDYYFIKQNPKNLFKNLRKAGKGGYGSVFTAKSIAENQMVAIKKMRHTNSKERAANYNEVKFLKKCDHPNIVKFISCYEYKDECWLVMEYLEGGTLTDARRGHDFEENEIAYVAKELLKGLAFTHSVGLIHRDLKSSNIMMSIMGDIKLIDFGLCSEARKAKPTMLGSPHWMPPEMILRLPHSYSADIWSFGISLLELTNRHPPTSLHKVKAMWLSAVGKIEPFEEPEKWSDNYKDFISKCLEKDPEKRSSAEELLKHPFLDQAANTRKVMRKILTEVFVQRAIGLF